MPIDWYRVRATSQVLGGGTGDTTNPYELEDGNTLQMEDGNDFEFEVPVGVGNQPVTQEIIVPANVTYEATFTGLVNGDTYDITVEAHNTGGFYGPAATDTVIPSGGTVGSPVAITGPQSVTDWVEDSPYPARTMSATGGTAPLQWTATGLPPGLFVGVNTGILQGTANTPGTYNPTITVTDAAAATDTQAYTMTIFPVTAAALSITTVGPLAHGTKGDPYGPLTFAAAGGTGPYKWNATAGLPAGMTLGLNSGVLAGTPNAQGATTLSVKVTDAVNATATKTFGLTIDPPAVVGSTLLAVNDPTKTGNINWSQFLLRNGIVENRPTASPTGDNGKPVHAWEQQGYKKANVKVDEGVLCIKAQKVPMTCFDGTAKQYTSGTLQTGGAIGTGGTTPGFQFKFGHLEFDYQTRYRGWEGQAKGRGLWAEMRMEARQGNVFGATPEIDVMDHLTNVGVISTAVKLGAAFNSATPIDNIARTRQMSGPVTYSQTITVPVTGIAANGRGPNLFDATGTYDISDNLTAWIIAHVPNGPSPLVHTRLVFPKTVVVGGVTKRAQYRTEGGLQGEMNFSGRINITIDGLSTEGSHGSNGAQLIAKLKTPFVAQCTNPRGVQRVDASTFNTQQGPNGDPLLTSVTAAFAANMVGCEITLDGNKAMWAIAATYSTANGGTIEFTVGVPGGAAKPHQYVSGHHFTLDNCSNDNYNHQYNVAQVTSPTKFTVTQQGNNPGGFTGGRLFTTEVKKTVTSFIDAKNITYSGAPYGEYGRFSQERTWDAVPVNPMKDIRYTTLANIIPHDWAINGVYAAGQHVVYSGHIKVSLRDNNGTQPASGAGDNADWAEVESTSGMTIPAGDTQRGEWVIMYLPTGEIRESGGWYYESDANGSAGFHSQSKALDLSGGHQFFQFTKCQNFRIINMEFQGSYPGGAYEAAYEKQDAFMFRACDDIEVGNCYIHGMWGNGLQTFPGSQPRTDGSAWATIGVWIHDCRFYSFGRQTMSFQIGGNIIVEHNILGGATHVLIDCEPTTSFSNHDSRLDFLVDGLYIFYNEVGHHGLGGMLSMHEGCGNVRVKGNRGDGIGSGSTWVADNVIVEDNGPDSGDDYPDGYTVFTEDTRTPNLGGHNIACRNNSTNARVEVLQLATSGNVVLATAGMNTSTLTGGAGDTLRIDPSPPPGYATNLKTFPNAGRLYVGLANDDSCWIDYNGKSPDQLGFLNCNGGGNPRTLTTQSPLKGLNGCENYTATGNSGNAPTVPQFIDKAEQSWFEHGGPGHGPGVYDGSWEAAVNPGPMPFRDAQWHTAEMDWDTNSITFKIDGVQIWSYTGTHVPQYAMYLCFQLAVVGPTNPNGWAPVNTADWDFGAELRIKRLLVTS